MTKRNDQPAQSAAAPKPPAVPPLRKHPWFLATTALALVGWIAFLAWLAVRG